MRVPIIMPQLGESIAEATIVTIAVKAGDHVAADQEIIEVETQKALLQVTTPCGGELIELLAQPQETYEVGATLGYVEASPEEAERLGLTPTKPDATGSEMMPDVEPGQPARNGRHLVHGESPVVADTTTSERAFPEEKMGRNTNLSKEGVGGLPVPARLGGASYLSPRVRARISELGLHAADLSVVPGTGVGGRVTTVDVEKFLANVESADSQPASALRVAVADSMRRSWTRPLATVGRSVQLDALFEHRKTQDEPKPGVTLYAIRALGLALGTERAAASRLIGKKIVSAPAIDIGFAVEIEDGLMVPVLRGVESTPLSEIGAQFQELVAAARRRQLPVGSSGDAAATVTNFGPFGLVWATPIPLPGESLMLGLGAGRKAPSWSEEEGKFVPVTEAEITLSFDHRVLDGGGAGRLLAKIVGHLEQPDQL